eukprot:TRINITY_DN428_c0_g1_i1.p1 TRINITY_DN428_c0_g1~~TRINITY_DN428_c0_g1_i1.p1  ORF type:complete len:214 (-),score=81.02 TRINITY_DN428_c0_g1_i1:541-1110(-)
MAIQIPIALTVAFATLQLNFAVQDADLTTSPEASALLAGDECQGSDSQDATSCALNAMQLHGKKASPLLVDQEQASDGNRAQSAQSGVLSVKLDSETAADAMRIDQINKMKTEQAVREKAQEKVQEKTEEKVEEKMEAQEQAEQQAEEEAQQKSAERVEEKAEEKAEEKTQNKAQEKAEEKAQEKAGES